MKKQRMLFILFGLFCMLPLSGCEDLEVELTISGHIYVDCTRQALKNRTIRFYGSGAGGGGNRGKVLFTTTTDGEGYFYANFKHNYPELSIQDSQNFGFTFFDLDPKESLIDHDFIIFETGRLQIKVQTEQSYTDQDTLYFDYFAGGVETKTFVGPFENNQILEDLEQPYNRGAEDSVLWGMGWNDYVFATQNWINRNRVENYQPYNLIPFEIGGCGTVTEVVIPLP